ncbi:MAG: DUF5686 and carboxypeptidase regulatory-like domain-containing protein [Paludibacter sp.]|nr:DUF5686 and carboxypeptidase regulatory-like domain-containing protein [Paludibacter sp.]
MEKNYVLLQAIKQTMKGKINRKSMRYVSFICLLCVLVFSEKIAAQEYVVVGQVIAKADRMPIPYASVYLKNTNIGTASDENGYFMLRHSGESPAFIVSCVGFKTREIKINKQLLGTTVEMSEEEMPLPELFVAPSGNPALELMRKVRLMRAENNVTQKQWYSALGTVQSIVFIDKIDKRFTNRKIFEQLKAGNLSATDSLLAVPIFMAENRRLFSPKEIKMLDENIFSSNPRTEKVTRQLTNQISEKINFYKNNVVLFDKSMISPLSNEGALYYNYYLIDSVMQFDRKLYEVHFRSRNKKNLVFSGTMKIDSATFALTEITADLPAQANLNFVHGLHIEQKFYLQNNLWLPAAEDVSLRMTYELLADSVRPKPEVFIRRNTVFAQNDTLTHAQQTFAESGYSAATIDEKIDRQNNTPIMRIAQWLADIVLTGYVPAGVFDLGKIENFARLTHEEGFRFTLPARTNELLWENISLGGYVGYGFGNRQVNYQGFAKYKLPTERFRTIGVSYTRDYRKIDYNYNDFFLRENPLQSGDEDIVTSLISFKKTQKLNFRHEFELSFFNEWNNAAESQLIFRSNKIFIESIEKKPLSINSLTFSNRFSFGDNKYTDHVLRIYSSNNNPVIYCILEGGKYNFQDKNGFYGKFSALINQKVPTSLGNFRYLVEGGSVWGGKRDLPATLLEIPVGSDYGGYSFYRFGLMNRMEYAATTYAALHTEMIFNGILMNQIPLIKHLNFREIIQFKAAWGMMNNVLPEGVNPLNKPYAEVGIGLTNILRCLSVQYAWRLADLKKEGIRKSGLQLAVIITF